MRTLLRFLAVLLFLAVSASSARAAEKVNGICEPATVTGQSAICPGGMVRLVATSNAPYGDWKCQWYRNSVPLPGENDEELFVTEPGDYQTVILYPDCTSAPSIPFTVSPDACQAAPAGLILDPFPNAGQSNGNGVLEPGERILLGPSWSNPGAGPVALAGNASNLVGPAGADYAIFDGVADYGTIAPDRIGNCFAASEDCYELSVSNLAAPRPEAHWDISFQETPLNGDLPTVWKLHVGSSFADVPVSHVFYTEIEKLFHGGVTAGCAPSAFCPDATGSRLQMAIFLSRAIAGSDALVPSSGSGYDCAGGTSLFSDVPPGDPFCRHANFIAARGATMGCEPGVFCAGSLATRIQMAVVVARAIAGSDAAVPVSYGPDPATGLSYSCDPATADVHFSDIAADAWFCRHAEYLRATGVISGYPDGSFQPHEDITRGQMAKFLSNGFHLQLFGK